MLNELLRYLDSGVSYSQDELARLTGADPDIIMAGIDCLAQMGYLRKVDLEQKNCGSGGCKDCPGCGSGFDDSLIPVMWERVKALSKA